MREKQEHLGISNRIAAGFLIVLALMASLTVLGLRHIAESNALLKRIVENNNVKTRLATTMQTALRERALSMHALSVLTDPFDKDAEVQRFDALGATYLDARQRLERLPLNKQEAAILKRIHSLTRAAQPEVQAIVELGMADDNAGMSDRIRNIALPWQREIAGQVNQLIELQLALTAAAVRDAETSYGRVRDLMLLLGTSALIIGLAIAFFVSHRVSRQARQLTSQALYDSLTGLPNRSLLQDRLNQETRLAQRSAHPFAVALMDLNHFKEVNDTLGHSVGDELLREVARRLRQSLRDEDTVARMGGDEFVVILHNLARANVPRCAEKLLGALKAPFIWEDHHIDLGASIGISLFPAHTEDPSSLIRYADIAMYAAKRSATGYILYAPEQEHLNCNDLSLKSELREAIQAGQLTLHYQPKIDHPRHRAVGLEALVRWNHPQRGLLSPDKFIPLAEETGLIGALTQWVLKTALAELAALHAQGHLLTMSVNLSTRSLHNLELPQLISTLLADHGLAAEYLTLEITESAVMTNPCDALAILGRLDSMGMTLAIDDFGTGYSSLVYLKQMPVDEIKIDKSFVIDMNENENDAVIVRSTIDLAHNLGLTVTAEGVETRDAWDSLSVLGCDHSQGYYMCKPLTADELLKWLEESPWATGSAASLPDVRQHSLV